MGLALDWAWCRRTWADQGTATNPKRAPPLHFGPGSEPGRCRPSWPASAAAAAEQHWGARKWLGAPPGSLHGRRQG
eukprot:1162096-Pelagomonas_calceolata.AAC.8